MNRNEYITTDMIDALDAAMRARTGEGLCAEQREVLLDPARTDEAHDMLADMQARMCVPADIIARMVRAIISK